MTRHHKPAPRVGALPVRRRRAVILLGLAVWVTGAVWLVFKYFIRTTDAFGFENPHPMQQSWLVAHAFASLVALWLFGALWPGHVLRGWRMKARRWSGGVFFGVKVWLALSGCALYYVGSDAARSWLSLLHWILGLAALALYFAHRRIDR